MEITYENIKNVYLHKCKNNYEILIKFKKPSDFAIPEEPPIMKAILYKKQKIFKNKKPGLYKFYDDKCLYFDISKKSALKGVIFFQHISNFELIARDLGKKKSNNHIGICLMRTNVKKEFYSHDSKVLESIMCFFKKRIFQKNFHQNYKALKQLGRGNFATVIFLVFLVHLTIGL